MFCYTYHPYRIRFESEVAFPELEKNGNGEIEIGRLVFRKGRFPVTGWKKKRRFQGFLYRWKPEHGVAFISAQKGGVFRIDLDQGLVHHQRPRHGQVSDELIRNVITGRIAGFFLSHLRSLLVFHAFFLLIKGKGVGFLGASRQGKSTLGTSFLDAQTPLLSDDLGIVQKKKGRFVLLPGLQEIRLWPSAARRLVPHHLEGRLVFPETYKKKFNPQSFFDWKWKEPVYPHCFYILSRKRGGNINISSLSKQEALMKLLEYLYNPIVLRSKVLGQNFKMAAEFVQKVPVKLLSYPAGFNRLREVRRSILQDL